MPKKSSRAGPFIATRKHHDEEIAEDYVEIVSDLLTSKGEAKVCDIASQLGVTHVTVIKTLERLKKRGLVDSQPHQPVTLTEEGSKLAAWSKRRHLFLLDYLKALGVPEKIAEIDVEGMEHHVSQATLDVLTLHLERLHSD